VILMDRRRPNYSKLLKSRRLFLAVASVSIFVSTAPASYAQDQVDFGYDDLGRLISVCHINSGQLDTFQYDPAGNRKAVSAAANSCGPSSFSVGNATAVAEGGTLSFVVTRSGWATQSQSVSYATANGSASSGSDYTPASGMLTFAIGDTSKAITVSTTNDTVYENNETVLLNLSSPTNGATVSIAQGSGTINNNDAAPAFSISDATSVTAGSSLNFTVTKSGSTALSHSVNYATANGTAIAGTHYTAASGTLTFTSGQTSQIITIATIAAFSGTKNLFVNLSSPTSGASIADGQGAGAITGNYAPVAVNDTVNGAYIVFDSVPVYVRANDSDPDGDPITVTAASCVSSGCGVTIQGGGTHISVRGNTAGTKTVNYTISDGKGGADTATATVGIFENDPCPLC